MIRACFTLMLLIAAAPIAIGQESEQRTFFSTLRRFHEPPLKMSGEAYRVLIFPDDSKPLVVRVEVVDGKAFITTKTLKRKGYRYRGISKAKTFPASDEDLVTVREIFRKGDLFSRPLDGVPLEQIGPPGSETICLHAPTWIFEQVLNGNYHRVHQDCPEVKELVNIGFELVRISKLRIPQDELFQ